MDRPVYNTRLALHCLSATRFILNDNRRYLDSLLKYFKNVPQTVEFKSAEWYISKVIEGMIKEIEALTIRIKRIAKQARRVLIYFNNHPSGYSVQNAQMLEK